MLNRRITKGGGTEKVDKTGLHLMDFFSKIGFGKVLVQIADKKPILIPKQKIEQPRKDGVTTVIYINKPIPLNES